MTSFDEAERLISAVDAEDINRITGKLAPALDGHGKDIKDFLERTDRVVTDINDHLPTTWETVKLAVGALENARRHRARPHLGDGARARHQ